MTGKLSWLPLSYLIIVFPLLVDALICSDGLYCVNDADCIPGTYCTNKRIFNGVLVFSKCLDKPANASCIASLATCGGIELNYFCMKLLFPKYFLILLQEMDNIKTVVKDGIVV